MKDTKKPMGFQTRAIHGGQSPDPTTGAVMQPIYQTSTFWFRNSREVIDYQEGKLDREEYGRYGNPTWRAVERTLSEHVRHLIRADLLQALVEPEAIDRPHARAGEGKG